MGTARRSVSRRSGERGAILTAAFFSALLASIASYLVLQIAISQARQARFHEGHIGARHAAEAGIVWAYERLTREAMGGLAYCGSPPPPPIGGLAVGVTVAPCPGSPQTISATVTY